MKIGWIDFSKDERDRALEILHMLQDAGAVDELGIGIVRDAFADKFFPGTSTLMTRAKYFVIVPYIIKEKIEEGAKNGWTARETLKAINDTEKRIAKVLLDRNKNNRHLGVIGSTALHRGGWVKRSPSELYWNGIRMLGIQNDKSMSLLEYIVAGLENLRAKGIFLGTAKRGEMNEGDDLDAGYLFGFRPMDIFGIYEEDWQDSLDILLNRSEARYLYDKIQTNLPESVWAIALKDNVDLLKHNGNFLSFSRDMAQFVDVENQRLLELGCYFSHIVYAARVRYNMMLQGNKSNDAAQEWEELLSDEMPKICPMLDIFEVLGLDGRYGYQKTTMQFLVNLAKYFHKQDWNSMDILIKSRELDIKGSARAKLLHPEKYSPEIWVGGRYLDYRLHIAARISQDIRMGLEGIDA